jgi:hypothetical protein
MHKEYPVGTMFLLGKKSTNRALADLCFVVEEVNNYRRLIFFQTNGDRWSAEIDLRIPQAWTSAYEVVYPQEDTSRT